MEQHKLLLLGMYIRICRRDKNYTQRELAEAAGISRSTLTQLESGVGSPSLKTVLNLLEVLGESFTGFEEFFNVRKSE